ncbi:hypothetical protein MTO96_022907, partial [Rhipicephalus appendiculatus]
VMEQWIQRYGKIFGMYLGDKPAFIITDVELVKECFIKREKWRKVRSVFNACFTAGKVKKLRRIIDGTVMRLVQKFDDASRFGDIIDAHEAARCMVLETLTSTVLGREVDDLTSSNEATLKSLEFIFREMDDAVFECAFAYPGLYGILQRIYPFTSFAKVLQKVMDDVLITLNNRRSGNEERKEDVLQHVVDAQEGVANIRSTTSASARLIDDHTLVCNLALLLLAGFDTTSASLAFLLYLLAKHPDEQVKIRDEIGSVLRAKEVSDHGGLSATECTTTTSSAAKQDLESDRIQLNGSARSSPTPHVPNDMASGNVNWMSETRQCENSELIDVLTSAQTFSHPQRARSELDEDDVMQLQRLDMVVREGLRLYPAVPMNVMRECREDMTVLGQFIPAGTSVFAPPWHIHRNAQIWPEPERFVPERFSPEQRDSVASSYYPFGLGPRTCVGHRLATITLKTALYRIVRNFDISLAEDLPDPIPVCVHNIVLNPAAAIKLNVTRSNI